MRVIFARGVTFGTTLLTLALLAGAPALAQSTPPPAKPGGWEFNLAPYIWGAGINGEVQHGRLPAAGVEASFSDLVQVLDLGLMGAFEARRDNWGFLVDGLYFSLSDEETAPNPAFGNVRAEMVQQIYTLAGTFRATEGKTDVDVIVGTRYNSLDIDLGLSGGIGSGREVDDSECWWDGFVGIRSRWHAGKNWTLSGYLDLGGGGSRMTWQGLAGAGYSFNKTVAAGFGYRYLSIDYETDDFRYDMAMAGPYVGLLFAF